MPRFRRYRVFLIFAVVAIVLTYQLSKTRNWGHSAQTPDFEDFKSPAPPKQEDHVDPVPIRTPPPEAVKESPKPAPVVQPLQTSSIAKTTSVSPLATTSKASSAKPVQSNSPVVLPDRQPLPPTKVVEGLEDDIHAVPPPGRQELPSFPVPAPTTIHWVKQVQHFPVPTESIILLPTGASVKIPRIQHNFNDESTDAKLNREKRQVKVKEEFRRAWNGYKKYAWLHDELSPLTGKFRDPFCGWAATLVDTLDTLWIMGLQEEFDQAAKAVDLIDFTTSPRNDIPMFETTIRYLGGLLAAYDVSGGKYKNLLDKAVELAEILMGAFDTPNRMPVLYYNWKPDFASQAHRASGRSNLAELGSLSMEFTRLAQLTKDPRYYDAVARVTDALSEWQDRGTKLDGVFPDNVDATGCNRTVPSKPQLPVASYTLEPALPPAAPDMTPVGYQPDTPRVGPEPVPKKSNLNQGPSGPGSLELQVAPGDIPKARIVGWDEQQLGNSKHKKRELDGRKPLTNRTISETTSAMNPVTGLPVDISAAQSRLGAGVGDWDCVPQGLQSYSNYGSDKFSMGGGQDSTYEYFPKQYLLLGGREEKYRKMYLKTIDAVRKWMLYRPMVPGDRDILFSGSVTTSGKPATDLLLTAEVEHLTCFIGGMVGMGAKVFGIDGDLEIAKKLTDGCVWAYEATESGIMPEGAIVLPCKSAEHCTWNETAWREYLDPMGPERDQSVVDYDLSKVEQAAEFAASKVFAETQTEKFLTDETSEQVVNSTDAEMGTALLKNDAPNSLEKRQSSPKDDLPKPITHNFADDLTKAKAAAAAKAQQPVGSSPKAFTKPASTLYEEKSKQTEEELDGMALTSGYQPDQFGQVASPASKASKEVVEPSLADPLRPLNHKEFVDARIEQENLPPGFVTMKSRKYILRPEAIESVWYMYRITGDTMWQEKGWKMFQAIIKATSTEYGHSAIGDVTGKSTYQDDTMESFWLAETLKYFYLLYSTPDTISLDEWVLNTEAHPFKRPTE